MSKHEERMAKFEQIIPSLDGLSEFDFKILCSYVERRYSQKAAKLTLDGLDLEQIKKELSSL